MSPEPINLLPPERRRALRRDYFVRLAVLAVALSLVLVLVAGVLLIPAYVFLAGAARTKQAQLASIESALSSTDETALADRLSSLRAATAILVALATGPSVSALIRETLSVERPGITLTGFSYTRGAAAKPGMLTIAGVSASRNSLRAYQLALASVPGFASVDLPVSSYAKDSDIPFVITVKLLSERPSL